MSNELQALQKRIEELEAENLVMREALNEIQNDAILGQEHKAIERCLDIEASVVKALSRTPKSESFAQYVEALEHLYDEARWYMQYGDLDRLEQALITVREVKQAKQEMK